MAYQVIINDEHLKDICNIIREGDEQYLPSYIPNKIRTMKTIGKFVKGDDVTNALLDGSFFGTYNNDTITEIRPSAFREMRVTSVNIPNVTKIGGSAFRNCTALEYLDLPSVKSVGSNAFAGCTSLQRVYLSGLTTFQQKGVGQDIFKDCTSLISVVLGDVQEMPQFVFTGCTNLQFIGVPWGKDDSRNYLAPWGAPDTTAIYYNYS